MTISVNQLEEAQIALKAPLYADVAGDLTSLCRGEAPGRPSPEAITVFKSVGAAIEDLAAAAAVWEALTKRA